jgi:ribosomal protein L11 methyltransferase
MSKEYIQIEFDFKNQDQFDMLVAELVDLGFDGFNEEEIDGQGSCKTYILSADYNALKIEDQLNKLFNKHGLTYSKSIIKEQNWNAVWESNFDPVRVGDFVGVRAHFHPVFNPPVTHEIKITPKMSFGTGHHATTFTVMQLMQEIDFNSKTVYDFGTGTGILAILAEKLGASNVLAVDNDDWCIENAEENIHKNKSKVIKIEKVESAFQKQQFDIILANVNRHIIEANLDALTQIGKSGGVLVLSGLLAEDQADIIKMVLQKGWNFQKAQPLNGWVSLLFNK